MPWRARLELSDEKNLRECGVGDSAETWQRKSVYFRLNCTEMKVRRKFAVTDASAEPYGQRSLMNESSEIYAKVSKDLPLTRIRYARRDPSDKNFIIVEDELRWDRASLFIFGLNEGDDYVHRVKLFDYPEGGVDHWQLEVFIRESQLAEITSLGRFFGTPPALRIELSFDMFANIENDDDVIFLSDFSAESIHSVLSLQLEHEMFSAATS